MPDTPWLYVHRLFIMSSTWFQGNTGFTELTANGIFLCNTEGNLQIIFIASTNVGSTNGTFLFNFEGTFENDLYCFYKCW